KNGQAPIDLNNKIVRRTRFPLLILNGHFIKIILLTLSIIFLNGDRIPLTVSGGPFINNVYEFHDAHFHWGEDDCRGAEHMINGTWYSMECHLVHWNKKYLTFEECLKRRDGLCVLTYLFLVQSGSNQWNNVKFERISENLKYIQNAGSETNIVANSLAWMRVATDCPSYYIYQGSSNLKCATWIVFPVIIPIQSCQLNEFRKLKNKDDEFIKSNWRNVQPLRGQQVFLAVS
ncbi:Carbonic anhydrase, partial [Trachymyrmex septentrionalis]